MTPLFAADTIDRASAFRARVAPGICTGPRNDPLPSLRAEAAKATPAEIDEWLKSERATGKASEALNWIRAVAPGKLPEGFPAKKGFARCASELVTYSDVRASKFPDPSALKEALADWSSCLDLHFGGKIPPEFEALRKCLSPK